MLREVGFEMGRRLYVSRAAEVDAWTTEFHEPFVAFIALEGRPRTDEELSDLARSLIDAGCIYSVTWGPQANRVDLYMDLVTIEKEEAAGLEIGGLNVMTVDFQGDPLAEALWYAVHSAYSPSAEITALVAVVDDEFREEIERYLSDIARLDEDFDVIYDAQVAAEQLARPRGWIDRLREKLSAGR
jgi:hypothetical protein